MPEKIKVGIIGALGRMGRIITHALLADERFTVTALCDVKTGKVEGTDLKISNFEEFLELPASHIVDFSTGQAVYEQGPKVLSAGKRYLVGATGYPEGTIETLNEFAVNNRTSCLVVPNFSIGANLMMKFSELAAKFFAHVEIIEAHHKAKLDAPSGTALATARLISARMPQAEAETKQKTSEDLSRGLPFGDVRVHSLRMDGVLAEQSVIFGAEGETLTIQHRTISRDCYLAGVKLALLKLESFVGLRFGLESILMDGEDERQ